MFDGDNVICLNSNFDENLIVLFENNVLPKVFVSLLLLRAATKNEQQNIEYLNILKIDESGSSKVPRPIQT